MGRQRKGWIRKKAGHYYVGLTLRSGRTYEKRIQAPENGAPLDKKYLDIVRAQLVRDYELRIWDPDAAPTPTAAPPADPVFYDFVHEFAEAQNYESAPKDQQRVTLYLPESPIASVRVRVLEPTHGQALIAYMIARPPARGGRLSASTVRNTFDISVRALDAAVEAKLLPSNPFRSRSCRRVLPAKGRKDPVAAKGWLFVHEEVIQLSSDERIAMVRRVIYAILFLTGMRVGELVVLRFRDWNRTTSPLSRITVDIARASVSSVEGPTKSKAVKLVPVHPALRAILTAWMEWGWERMMGRPPTPGDYVVPSGSGKDKGCPRNGSYTNKRFQKDCEMLGLTRRHIYCTRHTFITLTQDDGGDGTVLRWITHAPPRTSYDGYLRENWSRLCAELTKLNITLPVPQRDPPDGDDGGPSGPGGGDTMDDTLDDPPADPTTGDASPLPDDAVLGGAGHRAAHFEPVPAVGRLEVVDLLAGHPEDAPHRRCHVLVQPIRKLNDHDLTASRRAHEATYHRTARLRTKLAEHDLHDGKTLAQCPSRPHDHREPNHDRPSPSPPDDPMRY